MRSRIAAEDSAGSLLDSSRYWTAGASTWMSILSSSGPEIRDRYRSTCADEQRHSRAGSPKYPHAQGFIAAASMKSDGAPIKIKIKIASLLRESTTLTLNDVAHLLHAGNWRSLANARSKAKRQNVLI